MTISVSWFGSLMWNYAKVRQFPCCYHTSKKVCRHPLVFRVKGNNRLSEWSTGPWIFKEQAVLTLWEWLHLWQVRVCLEQLRQASPKECRKHLPPTEAMQEAPHQSAPSLQFSSPCLRPGFLFICHCQSDATSSLSVLSVIMTGAYNSFFRMFDRETGRGVTLEAWRESSKPRAVLRTRRVYTGGKRRRGDVGVDSLDFTKKILHMAWHPSENIIAIAATNNLYIFQDRINPETQGQWWTQLGDRGMEFSQITTRVWIWTGWRRQHIIRKLLQHTLRGSTFVMANEWQTLLTFLISEEDNAISFCSTLTEADISSTQMMFQPTNPTFWEKRCRDTSSTTRRFCCPSHWNTPF